MVWVLRHIRVNGRRRTLTSLLHGTMANAMPQALGLQKAFPGRQVISLSGDGGLAMLLGDLLTAVQENLPIKVVVFNNGSLNFVELEQKVEGLLDNYTDLKNPDFGRLAEVIADIAEEAARLILPYWRADTAVETKADASPVTEADRAAEALAAGDVDALLDFRTRAPGMPYAHPTVEHMAPLFVTLGAATDAGAAPTQVIDGFWMGLSKRSLQVA